MTVTLVTSRQMALMYRFKCCRLAVTVITVLHSCSFCLSVIKRDSLNTVEENNHFPLQIIYRHGLMKITARLE